MCSGQTLSHILSKAIRQSEAESVSKRCKDLVLGIGKSVLEDSKPFDIEPGKMESLNLKIDAILSLLERFGHEAEVPTLLDDFKKWLACAKGGETLSACCP